VTKKNFRSQSYGINIADSRCRWIKHGSYGRSDDQHGSEPRANSDPESHSTCTPASWLLAAASQSQPALLALPSCHHARTPFQNPGTELNEKMLSITTPQFFFLTSNNFFFLKKIKGFKVRARFY
jgi:hypothetical protein